MVKTADATSEDEFANEMYLDMMQNYRNSIFRNKTF